MTEREFKCIQGCSDCCVTREYYPSKKFGKIGVLLLPDEVPLIQGLARRNGVGVRILPRIATGTRLPDTIVAYQMMGNKDDGDLCPFLDTTSGTRSPHGGHTCMIYGERPRACKAYPLIDDAGPSLDGHCRFCKQFSTATANPSSIEAEAEALAEIKNAVQVPDNSLRVWRYATATGNIEDKDEMFSEGWVIEG